VEGVQIRAVISEVGLLNRADGSAKYTAGRTSVMAAVYGPIGVKIKDEILDRATIHVHWSAATGSGGPAEREKELIIKQVLLNVIIATLHPRTLIKIAIQELNDDGSLLSAAINAACMALVDAGISLKSWVASTTCAITPNGDFLLDPDRFEESSSRAKLLFAFNNQTDGVIACHNFGTLRKEEGEGEEFYLSCLAAARTSALTVFSYYEQTNKALYQYMLNQG
jgi:exosome complex component RRP46